ncbi:MAG: hypothetical protein ACOX6T_12405 [Myxococcales bacterium]
MLECPRLQNCSFFELLMKDQSSLAGLFRQRYCRARSHECARRIVEAAGLPVPEDLFPNQGEKAAEIIGAVAHARTA